MGIVVQEMVPAETAGVLFTRHPFTGNPRQMVITANYGLGEVFLFHIVYLLLDSIFSTILKIKMC